MKMNSCWQTMFDESQKGVGIMNKLYLASAALVAAMTLTGQALAADMPLKMPVKAPPPPPVCVWCGWYVGLNAGGDWGRADKTFIMNGLAPDPNFPFFDVAGSPSFRKTNFSGGAQWGVNSQWWGPWVVGAESDIEYIGLKGSQTATFHAVPPPPGFEEDITFSHSIRDNWVSTSRIRLGYAQDNWLFYGTAGIAVSRQRLTQVVSIPNFTVGGGPGGLEEEFTVGVASGGSHSKYVGGFAGGGGLEWKIAPDWSIRAEDIYIDLRRSSFDATFVCTSSCDPSPVGFSAHHEVRMWTNIARFAVNYQFPVNTPFLTPTRY